MNGKSAEVVLRQRSYLFNEIQVEMQKHGADVSVKLLGTPGIPETEVWMGPFRTADQTRVTIAQLDTIARLGEHAETIAVGMTKKPVRLHKDRPGKNPDIYISVFIMITDKSVPPITKEFALEGNGTAIPLEKPVLR